MAQQPRQVLPGTGGSDCPSSSIPVEFFSSGSCLKEEQGCCSFALGAAVSEVRGQLEFADSPHPPGVRTPDLVKKPTGHLPAQIMLLVMTS